MDVELDSDKKIRRLVANEEGVRLSLKAEAEQIHGKAEGNLARHKKTGNANVGVLSGDIDSYVYLEDPEHPDSPGSAMAIEFGHELVYFGERTGKYIPGLYVLSRAAGLV